MKYLFYVAAPLLIFSFLFHLYILITPAIDEFGFFGVFLHILFMSISWTLYLLATELKKDKE